MKTYYDEFWNFSQGDKFANERRRLGHNVKQMKLNNGKYRVYFSPNPIDISRATRVLKEEDK